MKKLLTLLIIGIYSISAFAQKENVVHCHKRDKHTMHSTKSATLTVNQISETEKYDVHFYALDLSMNNLVTTVAGTAEIHASANTFLDSALFELFETFTISQIRVNGIPVAYSRINTSIKAPVNAIPGSNFIISVDYNGTPPTAATNPLGGSGMTNDSSPSWGNQVTWSLSEPFSAYEWWPCKQSLADKADSCAVKITVPNACKAGSNGILENIIDLGNGTTRYEWKHRRPINYYLISVAVAQYVEYNVYANPVGAVTPILIQNFIYDNPATLTNFQNEIDETVDFLELFSEIYGMYPFENEKYGHCMAPLSGGMEHQTMTTQGFFNKGLTSHELGHQWWGNSVTCASWADIWINEGFASYSEYLMLENLYPAERAQFLSDAHENVMTQNGGSVWVEDSLNSGRIFSGRLTYDKGAAIIHTMRFILNDDVAFFQALKNFQIAFKDSVAKGMDMKLSMENESGLDLNNFFNEWYFGEGYPTYSARWNTLNNNLLLELTHTSSMPGNTPTFTNPIEIRISRTGLSDTIIRFDIQSNLNQFLVENIGNVTNIVSFDPNNWIINKVGTKIKDANFTEVTGFMELANSKNLILHPNPTEGTFKTNLTFDGDAKMHIISSQGAIVQSQNITENSVIDISGFKAGVYFIEVILDSNSEIFRSKVIKK